MIIGNYAFKTYEQHALFAER